MKDKLKWVYQIPYIAISSIWCDGCRNDLKAFFINRLWESDQRTLKRKWKKFK
jgi:hypothetical protein